MTYTINTSVRNVAENGTEEERTFYIVTGTQDGEATIIGPVSYTHLTLPTKA